MTCTGLSTLDRLAGLYVGIAGFIVAHQMIHWLRRKAQRHWWPDLTVDGAEIGQREALEVFLDAIVREQGANDHVWLTVQATQLLRGSRASG